MDQLPQSDALKVAELASVPDELRDEFCIRLNLLLYQVTRAHVVRAHLPRIRPSSISHHLAKLQIAAEKLCGAIEELESKTDDLADPNKRLARIYLEWQLRDIELPQAPRRTETFLSLQRERATQLIAAIKEASNRTRHLAKGKPKGIGGNPVFDWFVISLLEITQEAGGKLTHYHDRAAPNLEFQGSLRAVMDTLQPHLPIGFAPTGIVLDYALQHLSGRHRRKYPFQKLT
jgi:hypothetical protein